MQIRLKHTQAIYMLCVFMTAFFCRFIFLPLALPDGINKAIKIRLAGEYNASYPNVVVTSNDIELKNIKIKGLWLTKAVKVKITVSGETPPDGRSDRYFAYKYPLLLGTPYLWNEVSEFYYKTNIFN